MKNAELIRNMDITSRKDALSLIGKHPPSPYEKVAPSREVQQYHDHEEKVALPYPESSSSCLSSVSFLKLQFQVHYV